MPWIPCFSVIEQAPVFAHTHRFVSSSSNNTVRKHPIKLWAFQTELKQFSPHKSMVRSLSQSASFIRLSIECSHTASYRPAVLLTSELFAERQPTGEIKPMACWVQSASSFWSLASKNITATKKKKKLPEMNGRKRAVWAGNKSVCGQAGRKQLCQAFNQSLRQRINAAVSQLLTGYWLDVVKHSRSISAIDAENKQRYDLLCVIAGVCVCVC